ncbi:hypothetical protein QLX08_010493 [Tetragonisca angustula]|uniref:DUF4817 domain-containing protein n=1 Tax=Tetragonisca angustula TaxID=166442 RepID=A0AAW0ZC80_9HYME
MCYTIQEKVDIVLTYGESQRCLQKATRLYAKKFPHRVCPPCRIISNVVKRFRQTGNVDGKELVKRNTGKSVCRGTKTVRNKGNVRNSQFAESRDTVLQKQIKPGGSPDLRGKKQQGI